MWEAIALSWLRRWTTPLAKVSWETLSLVAAGTLVALLLVWGFNERRQAATDKRAVGAVAQIVAPPKAKEEAKIEDDNEKVKQHINVVHQRVAAVIARPSVNPDGDFFDVVCGSGLYDGDPQCIGVGRATGTSDPPK